MADSSAQLVETVRGLSDDELKTQVTEQGIDTTLETVFKGMEESFQADKAGSASALVQWDVETDEGTKSWTVNIGDGKATTSAGPGESPKLTLKIGLIDFIRMAVGQANSQQLFMSGKLKLQGDMMFAMQMANYFKPPA